MKNFENIVILSRSNDHIEFSDYDVVVRPGAVAYEDANRPGDIVFFKSEEEAKSFLCDMIEEGCAYYRLRNATTEKWEAAVKYADQLRNDDEKCKSIVDIDEGLEDDPNEYELAMDEFDRWLYC